MRLVLGVIGFVPDGVPARVFAEVNITVLLHPLPDRLGRTVMALLGRVDEIIVRAVHPLNHCLEARHVAIEQLARCQPLASSGLLDFLTMLVRAREEIDVIAIEPHETRDGVRGDRLIGMANVRRTIRI